MRACAARLWGEPSYPACQGLERVQLVKKSAKAGNRNDDNHVAKYFYLNLKHTDAHVGAGLLRSR